jgi:hypothetical protein
VLAESTLVRSMPRCWAVRAKPGDESQLRILAPAQPPPDGLGGSLSLEGAHGHSDYPRFSSDGLPRTTNYNIAAVIAGLSDDAVRQK